jgi:hypothetical protein
MVAIARADRRRGISERRPARHSLFTVTNPATFSIWARVSTDEQDTGNQLAELRQWAAAAAATTPDGNAKGRW